MPARPYLGAWAALAALVVWGLHPAIHSSVHGPGIGLSPAGGIVDSATIAAPTVSGCGSTDSDVASTRCGGGGSATTDGVPSAPGAPATDHLPCVICLGLGGALIPAPLLTPLWTGLPTPAARRITLADERPLRPAAPLISAPLRGPPVG